MLNWQLFSIQAKDSKIAGNEVRPNHFQMLLMAEH
jgi:hypothetical protein